MSKGNDDFLGRWARRKAETRGGLRKITSEQQEPVHKPGRMRTDPPAPKVAVEEADADVVEPETLEASLHSDGEETPVAGREPADEGKEASRHDELDEIKESESFDDFDFESLDYDSDYTRFMKTGVPESVRKRALRKLWASNPILANVDGLNDYDDDFTDAALAVKGLLKTAFKPLGGYLTDEEREASYSEEARKAGVEPSEEEGEELVADDDGGDAQEGDVETADASNDEAEDGASSEEDAKT
jgi:hypothetical protein